MEDSFTVFCAEFFPGINLGGPAHREQSNPEFGKELIGDLFELNIIIFRKHL